jgi:hypothetical protein
MLQDFFLIRIRRGVEAQRYAGIVAPRGSTKSRWKPQEGHLPAPDHAT